MACTKKSVRAALAAKGRHIPSTAAAIIDRLSLVHGITVPLMIGRRRTKQAAIARFDCWETMRKELTSNGRPVSYPKIAFWFARDHSTIVSGVKRASSAEIRALITEIHRRAAVDNSPDCLIAESNGLNLSAYPGRYQHPGTLNATT